MKRIYFCELYKYFEGAKYHGKYVHKKPEHPWDFGTIIRFKRLDPKPKDSESIYLQSLFVYISNYHGICVIDPIAMEMLSITENRNFFYVYKNNEWRESSVGFTKSKQLIDLAAGIPFPNIWDAMREIKHAARRANFPEKIEEAEIAKYIKDTEKDMYIEPPYFEMMDNSENERRQEVMLNGRYLFSIGLVNILNALCLDLDKKHLLTIVTPGVIPNSAFETFDDDGREVSWVKCWMGSPSIKNTNVSVECNSSGIILVTIPDRMSFLEIVQLDSRAFFLLPHHITVNDAVYRRESLSTSKWYEVCMTKISEYVNMANINNPFQK